VLTSTSEKGIDEEQKDEKIVCWGGEWCWILLVQTQKKKRKNKNGKKEKNPRKIYFYF
jgi:hypothetical protein